MSAAAFWEAISKGAVRGVKPERKGWKITLRDPDAPHQIVIGYVPGSQHRLYVSCNCRGYKRPGAGSVTYEPLEVRGRFEPHEPIEIWREHMTAVGAA